MWADAEPRAEVKLNLEGPIYTEVNSRKRSRRNYVKAVEYTALVSETALFTCCHVNLLYYNF